MSRFWLSWYQTTPDHRPLTFPPNPSILGWWCSGYNANDAAVICALVQADSEENAWAAVRADWPEYERRFIEERAPDHVIKAEQFRFQIGCASA